MVCHALPMENPDLVTLSKVDSTGRIVIDARMRKLVKIKEGDYLRLALSVTGDQWMISVVRPPKRDRSWSS